MGTRAFSPRRSAAEAVPFPAGEVASAAAPAPMARTQEAAALLLAAAAAFFVLSLGSYRADYLDPSVRGGDWVGPVGAAVAGFLAQGFGWVAWLLPLELALVAAPLFRRTFRGDWAVRLAGDLVVGVVLAALVQVAAPAARSFGGLPGGGNVGLLFGEVMRGLFSGPGSFLVGGTAVGLILIGRSSFSVIQAFERLVSGAVVLGGGARRGADRVGDAWVRARALAAERAEAERAARAPVIDPGSDAAIIAELCDEGDDAALPFEVTGTPPLSLSLALRSADAERRLPGTPLPGSVGSGGAAPGDPRHSVRITASPEQGSRPSAASPAAGAAPGSRRAPEAEEPTPTSAPAVVASRRDGGASSEELRGAGQARGRRPSAAPEAAEAPSAERELSEVVAEGETSDEPPAADDPPPSSVVESAPQPSRKKGKAAAGPLIVDTKPEQEVIKARKPARRAAAFALPSPELLQPAAPTVTRLDRDRLMENARLLEKTLADYGVQAKVEEILPGPTVTTYEASLQAGTKVSKVANLADDLALGLSRRVRIIAPIPGKSRVGFELENDERIPVNLRELVEDERFARLGEKVALPFVLGRDIVGKPFYADLAGMPHVIVAGATGQGKSVGLNVLLSSLLFCRTPDELRLLLIDPKVVELAPFDGIPHLLLPVVTDMKQAATALKWAVDEMERRYQLFANAGTKNIGTYNAWVDRVARGELPPPPVSAVEALDAEGVAVAVSVAKEGDDGTPLPGKLPFIVIVLDEFADLMMQQGKEVETSVARLAQKARAAGMHVVLATQRPSVDVITGMIKANFPSRIAYRVAQKVDSRTVLDEQGAEWLLGRGDMLVKLNGADTRRVQCPFVSEEEVAALTDHLRAQGAPQYHDAILLAGDDEDAADDDDDQLDARFDEAVRIVAETRRASTSWLQRKMTIGYNRAAKIVEAMERRGMVGPPNGAKDREVLMPPPTY